MFLFLLSAVAQFLTVALGYVRAAIARTQAEMGMR